MSKKELEEHELQHPASFEELKERVKRLEERFLSLEVMMRKNDFPIMEKNEYYIIEVEGGKIWTGQFEFSTQHNIVFKNAIYTSSEQPCYSAQATFSINNIIKITHIKRKD